MEISDEVTKLTLSTRFPVSVFLCLWLVRASLLCMASRAVTGCENKDNQTLFLTTTITNTNMLEKE